MVDTLGSIYKVQNTLPFIQHGGRSRALFPPAIHAKGSAVTYTFVSGDVNMQPHIKECMGNLNCPQNVVKCKKIGPPAHLTCVVVIPCVSRVFGGDLAVI